MESEFSGDKISKTQQGLFIFLSSLIILEFGHQRYEKHKSSHFILVLKIESDGTMEESENSYNGIFLL